MNDRRLRSFCLAGLCGLLSGGSLAGQGIPVPFHSQQTPFWCWAAATQMAVESVDPTVTVKQADLAKANVYGCTNPPTNTCGSVSSPDYHGCDKPGFPAFKAAKFEADRSPALSWIDLKGELDSCRPVVFGWCDSGSCPKDGGKLSGHWMVAAAAETCEQVDGTKVQLIRVLNPAPCCFGQKIWIPYSTYTAGQPDMEFWENYSGLRKEGTQRSALPQTTACQLSSDDDSAQVANFRPGSTEDEFFTPAVRNCLNRLVLLPTVRDEGIFSTPAIDGGGGFQLGKPWTRKVVSLRRFMGLPLHAILDKFAALIGRPSKSDLRVVPVVTSGGTAARVVLEPAPGGGYQLNSIEEGEYVSGSPRDFGASTQPHLEVALAETGTVFYRQSEGPIASVSIANPADCSGGTNDGEAHRLTWRALRSLLRDLVDRYFSVDLRAPGGFKLSRPDSLGTADPRQPPP